MSAAVMDATVGAVRVRPAGWEWLRDRGMGATVLVAAISTGFGVLLLSATGYIGAVLQANPEYGDSDTLAGVVLILGVLLLAVAVYVAAIVTANTFATIIAGRTRRIALMRILGASARSQRAEVARQGLVVGVLGAVTGLVAATLVGTAAVPALDALTGVDSAYVVGRPELLAPAAVVALTTWLGAWVGSRRVLEVTPLQALGNAVDAAPEQAARRPVRHGFAAVLAVSGAALLGAGVLVGLVSPLGVVIAFFGGLFSFTGITMAAPAVMRPLLRLTARAFGGAVSARLAARNVDRHPDRSARMAIGIVVGVALVTMFAVAAESVKALAGASGGGGMDPAFAQQLDAFALVMMLLVAVSAVTAAIGLVNLLTIGVVQRRRELGLLRALGLSVRQVRRVVLFEAAHVTVTALVLGLVLGVVYGWAGAQSLLGSIPLPPEWLGPTFVAPAIPWATVLAVAAATAVITAIAAIVPTRLATRVVPVEALADTP